MPGFYPASATSAEVFRGALKLDAAGRNIAMPKRVALPGTSGSPLTEMWIGGR